MYEQAIFSERSKYKSLTAQIITFFTFTRSMSLFLPLTKLSLNR